MKGFKFSLILLLSIILYSCTSLNAQNISKEIMDQKFVMFAPYIDNRITVEFSQEKISGFSGVNRFFGGYKIDETSITMGPLASTMMAGPIEDMVKEKFILSALNNAEKISFENEILIITTKEKQNLKFKKLILKK